MAALFLCRHFISATLSRNAFVDLSFVLVNKQFTSRLALRHIFLEVKILPWYLVIYKFTSPNFA
jgi:hypothetical protein